MKRHVPGICIGLLFTALSATAWENIFLQPENARRESAWREALAVELGAEEEFPINGGRVDVLTPSLAIEVDWPHKWHEGLGQALHYADATERTGALALISYSKHPDDMRQSTREKMKVVDRQCEKNGIQLFVLFAGEPVATAAEPQPPCWLNTKSMSIHWPGCRYFENTAQGRRAWPDEGRACGQCFEEGKTYKGPRKP